MKVQTHLLGTRLAHTDFEVRLCFCPRTSEQGPGTEFGAQRAVDHPFWQAVASHVQEPALATEVSGQNHTGQATAGMVLGLLGVL